MPFHCFSFVSGITLLGLPTEVYSYGIQYVYVVGAVILMGFVMGRIFLPVFHDLNITSTYEVRTIFGTQTQFNSFSIFTFDFSIWKFVTIDDYECLVQSCSHS